MATLVSTRMVTKGRGSSTAGVDEGEDEFIVNPGLACHDEHPVLFHKSGRAAARDDREAGSVNGHVNGRARHETDGVAQGLRENYPAHTIEFCLHGIRIPTVCHSHAWDPGGVSEPAVTDTPAQRLVFAEPKTARKPAQHLADLDRDGRRAAAVALGAKPFRADQLSRHYFGLSHDGEMTDLPAADRENLKNALLPDLLTPVRSVQTDDGATRKTLWRGHDGVQIESVLMRYPGRVTVCVSSQAGCGMACPFCATGQGGLARNLSAAEIVEQVVAGARAAARGDLDEPATSGLAQLGSEDEEQPGTSGLRLSNVVFMGMGEPLANYSRVLTAVRAITTPQPHGLGLSARSVTVSTVGLVPRIRQLAEEKLPVTLALSLHAPDDELRNTLVPVNTRWPVREVLDATFGYAKSTGRRVSIEYVMIEGVNDSPERAELLASLLKGQLVHVNLIPLNPTPGSDWREAAPAHERAFLKRLRDRGINTTVRDTRGREIAGACGQLAAIG